MGRGALRYLGLRRESPCRRWRRWFQSCRPSGPSRVRKREPSLAISQLGQEQTGEHDLTLRDKRLDENEHGKGKRN
jgi:hypothetical protein